MEAKPEIRSLSRLRERVGVRARDLRQNQTEAEKLLWGRDTRRSEAMAAEGFATLRFWNHEVLIETEAVMEKIRQVAETLTPTLSRKRERE